MDTDAKHREEHAQYGVVQVRAWAGVHAKTQNHPQHGSYRRRSVIRGTLVLVEVDRLPRQTRIPKRLWLWWRGPGAPDLAVLWRAYVHRFDLEQGYRQMKQELAGGLYGALRPGDPPPLVPGLLRVLVLLAHLVRTTGYPRRAAYLTAGSGT